MIAGFMVRSIEFQERMDKLHSYLRRHRVPKELIVKANDFAFQQVRLPMTS